MSVVEVVVVMVPKTRLERESDGQSRGGGVRSLSWLAGGVRLTASQRQLRVDDDPSK